MPVYLFALSQVLYVHPGKALLIFFILHVLVYPASNGFNSYMDRDSGPIGGVRAPLTPGRQLLYASVVMDLVAVLLGLLVSIWFSMALLVYILASRAYSDRRVRLKKYPWLSYGVVALCQGALVFWMTYHGSHMKQPFNVPLTGMLASSLLIAGSYPLTQVYQHEADQADGVRTISMVMGHKGTFRLSAIMFNLAFIVLGLHFGLQLELERFFWLLLIELPVLAYFLYWARLVWKDKAAADFDHAMRMNLIAAICTNAGFLMILIWKYLD
nr:UbiA family prenyltransferase [Flavihumibacter rivuli]